MRWLVTIAAFAAQTSMCLAAPADQVDCLSKGLTNEQRFDVLESTTNDGDAQNKQSAERGSKLIEARIQECAVRNHWSDAEAEAAMAFTMVDNTAAVQRFIFGTKHIDHAVLDTYFAENRASLVAGPDDPDKAQAAAKAAIGPKGYPVADKEAFDDAMSYLGMLIMAERYKAEFVAGKSPMPQ